MDNTISNSIMPQFRTTYQDLPVTEKTRIEASAVENPTPTKYAQPPMPTRPSPKAPGSSASSIKSDAPIDETPVRNDDIKPSLANRLGAKLLVAGAGTLSFLQKIVNAIKAAAKAVVAKITTGAQASKTFVAAQANTGVQAGKAGIAKVNNGAKAAKNYVSGLSFSKKPVTVDEKAKDVSETSSASEAVETK